MNEVRNMLTCEGVTDRCAVSIPLSIVSLMPKIAPMANTPAAMLNTLKIVRTLLCQRSNQTFCQMTLMLLLRANSYYAETASLCRFIQRTWGCPLYLGIALIPG